MRGMPGRMLISKETLHRLYYEEGLTQAAIARKLGCHRRTVREHMKAYHMRTRTAGDYTRVDLPREELRRLYLQCRLSLQEVASQFGCSVATVQKYLKRYGIVTRPPGWNSIRCYVPDNILARWSPELAYVVGLIAADGYLDRDYNCVGVKSTDLELIQLYCRCLHIDGKVRIQISDHPRYKLQYGIKFSDPKYRAFLESIGLTPAKSKTMGALVVPDEVFSDFLRGYMDGDGSWYVCHRHSKEYLYAQFASGSPAFLEWLNETVQRLTGLQGSLSQRLLRYGARKAVEIGSWIYYSPSVPCLRRKRLIWESFACECNR